MLAFNKKYDRIKMVFTIALKRSILSSFFVLICIINSEATTATVVTPNFTLNPLSATVGQTVTVNDLTSVMFDCAPDGITYSWDFGAGANPPSALYTINSPMNPTINAAPTQMVIYSTPGLKTITLTVFAEDDCDEYTAMTSRTINILPAPAAIPTISEWGLLLLILLILILGTLKLMQGRWTSDITTMRS